jgi:hypothetical protein
MSVVGHVANYLIDDKAGIILDAEGTRANRMAEIVITETGASPPPLRSAAPKARWRLRSGTTSEKTAVRARPPRWRKSTPY